MRPSAATLLGEAALKKRVSDKYSLQQVIGQGTFGVVRKCKSKKTGEIFAIKTIIKSKVPNLEILKREIDILSEVHHPHIIRLHDVYEEETKIHLVTELCTGGELYDRVVEKSLSPEQHFSEHDAARIMHNVLDAISYCHDVKHVVHRDLKVENFLLLNKRDDSPVKIIDFGLSRYNHDNMMKSRVGTAYYVAPEVLTDKYTNKCDIWSCGVIAYVLLCGFPPFYHENERKTLELVKFADLQFPSPTWDDISDDAKRFVQRLLDRDPDKRPEASEALKDPWLQDVEEPVAEEEQIAHTDPAPAPKVEPVPEKVVEPVPKSPKPIQMKTKRREMFQRFLTMVKVRKSKA